VAVRALRLRTLHPAENISSALKRGVNLCQRRFLNEVLGFLVTEFVRNFGGEGATPIQRGFNASLLGRVQAVDARRRRFLYLAAGATARCRSYRALQAQKLT
jgi:hypothetical protein